MNLVYPIDGRIYVNLTNRCTARCVFCTRETDPTVAGFDLRLDYEPPAVDYLRAIGDPTGYEEVVFCGFGEPTLRLAELVEIGVACRGAGARVRLNTNGHGSLIAGYDIVPDLASAIDAVSISIDASDARAYARIVRSTIGTNAFESVLGFVRECRRLIPSVTLSAVALRGLDLDACRRLAQGLGVAFRVRPYARILGAENTTERDARDGPGRRP
jgi:TatD DNase family protein